MIRVEVITPERIAFEGEGRLVSVPTTDGTLGIGAGHVPLLATIRPGEVIVRRPGTDKDVYLAVAGGFVEILPDMVRVMADSAEHAHELNESAIQEAIKAAERAKSEAKTQAQLSEASQLIEYNQVRLKLAQRRHSRGGHLGISNENQ